MDQYISEQPSYNLHFCKKIQPSQNHKISTIKHYLDSQIMYKKLLKKRNLKNTTHLIQPQLNFFLDQLKKSHMSLEDQNFYEV